MHAFEATHPRHVEASLRLRYEVFCEEVGDHRYADHVRRLHVDRDDGPQSHVLVATNDEDDVIGTMRLTLLRECQFIGIDAYDLPQLALFNSIPLASIKLRLARVDRVVVAKQYRGSRALTAMHNACEGLATAKCCDVLVGVPGVDNALARQVFSRLGYKEYCGARQHSGVTCQPICKRLAEQRPH